MKDAELAAASDPAAGEVLCADTDGAWLRSDGVHSPGGSGLLVGLDVTSGQTWYEDTVEDAVVVDRAGQRG